MKRINAYLTTIILLFSIQVTSIMAMEKENIKQSETSPKYEVKPDSLNSFFFYKPIPTKILIEIPTKKIIARFQTPDSKEYGTFNSDQRFLLILSAIWTPVYDENPKLFQWHLFDTDAKKTIKKFPEESYPVFDERNNQIVCEKGYPSFPLPTEPAQSFFDATMKTFKNSFSWLFAKSPETRSNTTITTIPKNQQTSAKTIPKPSPKLVFASNLFHKKETNNEFTPQINSKRILTRVKIQNTEEQKLKEEEEEESDDEESFSSVIEEAMYTFKQYINKNEQEKASSVIDEIITELTTKDEDGSLDNQTTVIENYRQYLPAIQKQFTTKLVELYKKRTQNIKEQFTATLFAKPYGDLYDKKHKEKNEIENQSNNVIATIKKHTINGENQTILTFTSIKPGHLLSMHPVIKSIRAKIFCPSGKFFALSYEKLAQDTFAPLIIFTQAQNKEYTSMRYSIKDSPEIIGLLFLDDFTLLTLDKDYSMTVINLPKNMQS